MRVNKKKAGPFLASVKEKSEAARAAALYELKDVKADLATLEKALRNGEDLSSFSPFDIVHGAFELFRHVAALTEHAALSELMEEALSVELARHELEKKGAQFLKKPAGWHWISPKGEMHCLCAGDDPKAALETLGQVSGRGKAKGAGKPAGKAKVVAKGGGSKTAGGKVASGGEAASRGEGAA